MGNPPLESRGLVVFNHSGFRFVFVFLFSGALPNSQRAECFKEPWAVKTVAGRQSVLGNMKYSERVRAVLCWKHLPVAAGA